jgi:soluble lytic murein transglycosylase-like protein
MARFWRFFALIDSIAEVKRLSIMATAAGALAAALLFWVRRMPTSSAVPVASEPSNELRIDDAHEREILRTLSQAEGLIRLGKPRAAAALVRAIPTEGPHGPSALRVSCWALLLAGANQELAALLDDDDIGDSELAYLRAAARWRAGQAGEGMKGLRELWWAEPDGVWGLAAVRELAALPVKAKQNYDPRSLAAVRQHIPRATLDTPRRAGPSTGRILETLARTIPSGTLAAEVQHAMGVYKLRTEKFSEATAVLERAISMTRNSRLRRVIELRLGQAERRRGEYQAAQRHFTHVAKGGDDRFASEALALAGQMAIEYRRYATARRLFKEQLVGNPVGPARHTALWGLGWVAFRTADYRAARRFFRTLLAEAPVGELAPRAVYWGARALEELGSRDAAGREMAALELRFPVDYYAYRARLWRGTDEAPDLVAVLPSPRSDPRVLHISALVEAGMLQRARRALRDARHGHFGPDELRLLADAARVANAPSLARSLDKRRFTRFPDSRGAIRHLISLFPAVYAQPLADAARAQLIDPDLPVALVLQESGFSPRAVSAVGALGLMQLMPETARQLFREENRHHKATSEEILDPRNNIRLGVRYLARMVRAFNRRVEYALAAYNAGPGAVTRWRQARGDFPADIFVEEIPYPETRSYVRRVLAALQTLHFIRDQEQREPASTELARATP